MNSHEVQHAYDVVAGQYQTRFADELAHKPFDRAWLDRFAAERTQGARVVEVGCGDGHVAAYLAAQGLLVEGLDLSPEMVRAAQRGHPHLEFCVGDALALPFDNASFDAIVAFYSIVNLNAERGLSVITAFAR